MSPHRPMPITSPAVVESDAAVVYELKNRNFQPHRSGFIVEYQTRVPKKGVFRVELEGPYALAAQEGENG